MGAERQGRAAGEVAGGGTRGPHRPSLRRLRAAPVTACLAGTLEPHWSGLLWTAMLVSLAIVIALPKPHGIRALIASTILRLIFSVGLQPTLFLLGAFNVSPGLGTPSPLGKAGVERTRVPVKSGGDGKHSCLVLKSRSVPPLTGGFRKHSRTRISGL